MKIAYNWLKTYLPTDWPATKTAACLTDLGLEVEGIETFESIKGSLEGVVVGKVLKCKPHPNADRLSITTVDVGQETPLQIVCGAPNVSAGQTVAVATIGTKLYDADGKEWVIKKSKIRDAISQGMICAEDELGLGDNHDGIMVLDNKLKAGTPCAKVFDIEKDEIFEIGLTPNRADAMSHYGVARDLRAALLMQKNELALNLPALSNFRITSNSFPIKVEVANPSLCPRYCGLTISGVEVKPSPSWLQNRLRSIGLNPKNNVVDVTNFVMHELGQPLHAFDANSISSHKISVKTLASNTSFTTLDGEERKLHAEDLMICDGDTPLCIAGVFGGLSSGVTENTQKVFLESAYFNPVSVRKTAKRHGLSTDASFRFERGVDINMVETALKRAAILIVELAKGEITSEIVDEFPLKTEDHKLLLNYERMKRLIGEEIPKDKVKQIIRSLDIKVASETETGLGLLVPDYRVDVRREVDVIEEILRVYGYNNIVFSEKMTSSLPDLHAENNATIENRMADFLTSIGFSEMMSNSLSTPEYVNSASAVGILNPLSKDLSVMRTSLIPGGLEAVSYNLNRRKNNIHLFEFGHVYEKGQKKYQQSKVLMLVACGAQQTEGWNSSAIPSDFFYIKGVVGSLLSRIGVSVTETPFKDQEWEDAIALTVQNKTIGILGHVAPSKLNQHDIEKAVVAAQIHWKELLELSTVNELKVKEIPKIPDVKRDLALLIDSKVSFQELHEAAFKVERKLLTSVQLFDVYQGKNLPENSKSYGLTFTLQDAHKTLTDKEVDKVMRRLVQTFEKEFNAQLR